jgi:hypothetical protein
LHLTKNDQRFLSQGRPFVYPLLENRFGQRPFVCITCVEGWLGIQGQVNTRNFRWSLASQHLVPNRLRRFLAGENRPSKADQLADTNVARQAQSRRRKHRPFLSTASLQQVCPSTGLEIAIHFRPGVRVLRIIFCAKLRSHSKMLRNNTNHTPGNRTAFAVPAMLTLGCIDFGVIQEDLVEAKEGVHRTA